MILGSKTQSERPKWIFRVGKTTGFRLLCATTPLFCGENTDNDPGEKDEEKTLIMILRRMVRRKH